MHNDLSALLLWISESVSCDSRGLSQGSSLGTKVLSSRGGWRKGMRTRGGKKG